MKENIKHRDKSTHLWTHLIKDKDLSQRRQEYTLKKRQSLQQVVLGKLVKHL